MKDYYVADVRSVAAQSRVIASDVQVRPSTRDDIPALAELYLRSYGDPATTFDDALAEMHQAFDGSWGALWPDASPVAWIGSNLVAVVQTVRRPTMDDAPDCPWLIEVFTDPPRRRTGLAYALVVGACRVLEAAGEGLVGLTADDDNEPALALYRSLGFSEAQ